MGQTADRVGFTTHEQTPSYFQACQLGKPKKEENYSLMPTSVPPIPRQPPCARSLKRASPRTIINKHINKQLIIKQFYSFLISKEKKNMETIELSALLYIYIYIYIYIYNKWVCVCVCVCV